MRQDRVVFSGDNPFNEFAKCKELTVLLGPDKFVLVATLNSINIMTTFNSIVNVFEGSEKIQEAYTIPLSLVLPLFRLDSKDKDNSLSLETTVDKVTITYNGVSVDTAIYSPNGLTIQQISDIDTSGSMEVSPAPFIKMTDVFGTTQDNFCNVDGKTLFISDESKCLIEVSEVDYQRKFSISIQFIRMMKSMGCTKLFIGENIVAQTKTGLLLVTNLTKITDPNALLDYAFASRIKSEGVYTLALNKYLKQIGIAVQSSELDASLDLDKRQLILTSLHNEKVVLQLADYEVSKEGEFDFFAEEVEETKPLILNDPKLLKSLASFTKVRIKVCPSFLIARLGKTHKLMFTLGRS